MHNLRSSELANAAELRSHALLQRFAAVGFMAALLHVSFGWPLVWLWAGAYVAASLLEAAVGRAFVSRLDGSFGASGAAYTACIAA